MSIEKEIRPVTYLKTHAADLLKQVNETQRPVIITQNGEPRGVLLDPASYDSMRKFIAMMQLVSASEKEIKEGKGIPHDEVMASVRKALEES